MFLGFDKRALRALALWPFFGNSGFIFACCVQFFPCRVGRMRGSYFLGITHPMNAMPGIVRRE
jgi:hypothetical protein